MEMVIRDFNRVSLTGLGKVSAWLYLSPYDVYAWYSHFNQIFEQGTSDDLLLSWALTDIPSNDMGYIPGDLRDATQDFQWKLRNRGIKGTDACHVSYVLNERLKGIEFDEDESRKRAIVRTVVYDISRIKEALVLIDDLYGRWGKKDLWNSLVNRVTYGVPEEMAELTRLPGIGGVRARKLWEQGIQSISDITERTVTLNEMFEPEFVRKIQQAAHKIIQKTS
jgi:replicative superfamily II helicase